MDRSELDCVVGKAQPANVNRPVESLAQLALLFKETAAILKDIDNWTLGVTVMAELSRGRVLQVRPIIGGEWTDYIPFSSMPPDRFLRWAPRKQEPARESAASNTIRCFQTCQAGRLRHGIWFMMDSPRKSVFVHGDRDECETPRHTADELAADGNLAIEIHPTVAVERIASHPQAAEIVFHVFGKGTI